MRPSIVLPGQFLMSPEGQFPVSLDTLVRISQGREGGLWSWINGLLGRRAFNVVVAAVANKLARILWALLSRGETYRAAV